jgi:hypothetical protein
MSVNERTRFGLFLPCRGYKDIYAQQSQVGAAPWTGELRLRVVDPIRAGPCLEGGIRGADTRYHQPIDARRRFNGHTWVLIY